MNDQQVEAYGSETHIRIAAAQTRLTRLNTVETKLRKLNAALANLAISERPQQLGLIRAARKYVDIIAQEPVQGIKANLRVISNELQCFDEGIRARTVTMSDLVLTSGVRAIKDVRELRASVEQTIVRLQAVATASGEHDPSAAEIELSKKALADVPVFGEKPFLIHKMPVAFSGQNANVKKFSKVGYVNTDLLSKQGFSAGSIGGYTTIRKQLCIGIPHTVLYREHPSELDEKTGKPLLVRRTVRETKQVNKGGKPTKVDFRRERTALDEAKGALKLMEEKSGTSYTFISQKGAGYKGGVWFWVMQAADVRRFARAFPGGHIDILQWGIAGEAE